VVYARVGTVGLRYYNPVTGRYISRDPAGYPNGLNNYLYVNDNPINRIDPLGLWWDVWDAIVAVCDAGYGLANGVTFGAANAIAQSTYGQSATDTISSMQQSNVYQVANATGAAATTVAVAAPGAPAVAAAYSAVATSVSTTRAALAVSGVGTAATVAAGSPAGQATASGLAAVVDLAATGGASPAGAVAAKTERAVAAATGEERAAGVSFYPPNRGFAEGSGPSSLIPGAKVDRYGGTGGSFVSPAGTPAAARSLPPGVASRPLNTYEVVKPIEGTAGPAAPWFGQPGKGTQFDLGKPVQDLLDSGHLREVSQ
jgi:hypothetical protein